MAFVQTMKVFFYASDPQSLLDAGFDRIRVEKSTDRGSTWEAVTDDDTDVIIEASRHNYWFVVEEGDTSELFRAVLHAADGTPADVPQAPTQAIDTTFESILTIQQLKNVYLYGINLTEDTGAPYPDELYAHYIRMAIDQVEKELDVKLLPTKIVGERYDFYRRDYQNFGFVQLREYPIISVERYALQYPGSPNEIIKFDPSWIQADKGAGHLQVYPAAGVYTNAFISAGGGYLPLILGGAEYLPNLIVIDYTAGFELGKVPEGVREIVGKKASSGPLNTAGDLIAGAGIATKSLSIDGLSSSVGTTSSATNSGYGARLIQYEKEIKTQMKVMKAYLKGNRLTAV